MVSHLTAEWAKEHQVLIALFDSSRVDYSYGGSIIDMQLPASTSFAKKFLNVGLRSKQIRDLLRYERPDRVFTFMESASFPTIAAAALSNYLDKLWISVHVNPKHKPAFLRFAISVLYHLPNRIVAVSKGVKQALESLKLPGDRISVIYNPVIVREPRNNIHDLTKLDLKNPFILAAGRLVRQKGFDQLLSAFQRLNHPELHLAILGEGPERKNLIQQARELRIRDRVHFPGRVKDIEPWYRHAQCFVLSSRYEGWGNVLLEAMANGCPVASFDCPYGPSEMIDNDRNGLLVSDQDVDALSSAVNRLLSDEYLRQRLSNNGREQRSLSMYPKLPLFGWNCLNENVMYML